ncbi:peptidylprolyl isomerase [Sphingobium aromaticiconvertens]|uniref:peptidylprolyl isomerase n=1 Tax=Sphingobium aromaticiconvertens TaxID=365341 RepID=UPI003AFB35FD
MMRPLFGSSFALALLATAPVYSEPVTPSFVVAQAPATAWQVIPANDLLVMMLPDDRRVVIQLAPVFSRAHVANIRTLARAHWWDGTSINRVQDNYVVQWGDRSEKKPLPADMPTGLVEAYTVPLSALGGARITPLPYPDSYARKAGFIDGWPVAMDERVAWLPHCYAMVGVGRNLSPDAGTGAELYAVIGQAPRQLDRNIAVVGRVIEGMEVLSSLPRGSGDLGFYKGEERPIPILSVRLGSDLPAAKQPRFQIMDTASASFAAWLKVRANRKDDFYNLPAGGVDLCNAPVPIRHAPPRV